MITKNKIIDNLNKNLTSELNFLRLDLLKKEFEVSMSIPNKNFEYCKLSLEVDFDNNIIKHNEDKSNSSNQ